MITRLVMVILLVTMFLIPTLGLAEDQPKPPPANGSAQVQGQELPFSDPTIRAEQYEMRVKQLERTVNNLERQIDRLNGRFEKMDQDLRELKRKAFRV